MVSRIRLVTLNVRGLASPDVRSRLFFLLRSWPVDVCCLQEVHAPEDASFWTTQWGGAASWNHHTAILFNHPVGSPQFDAFLEILTFITSGVKHS